MSKASKIVTGVVATAVGITGIAAAQAQEGGREPKEQRRPGCEGKAKFMAPRLVHSETKRVADEGFAIVTVDQGRVESSNDEQVSIKRQDGEVVTVRRTEDTKVCRDGKEAKLSDLEPGDFVGAVQVEKDGERKVRGIRAYSEEYAQQHANDRREKREGRRGRNGRGPGGDPQQGGSREQEAS